MLRSFCDKCGTECQPKHSGSRRFTALAMASSGVALGFELLPLFAEQTSSNSHVCDSCIPELLSLAIDTYAESEIVREKHIWANKLRSFEEVEREVNKRIAAVEQREAMAQDQLRSASERVQVADKQHAADLQRIQILTSQLEALRQAQANRERQAAAEAAQREADAQAYPDYALRVAAREKKRASG